MLSYFGRRVLPEEITYRGEAEAILLDLALQYGASVLPGTLSVTDFGRETAVNIALDRTSVLSAMRRICAQAGVGMRLRFDPDVPGFSFVMREEVSGAHFLSRSAGTVLSAVRSADLKNYANRIVVLGEEGNSVTVEAAGLFSDGVDDASYPVREIFLDATELALSRYASVDAYQAALRARGKRILAGRRPVFSVSVKTDEATARKLSVGEKCPVSDDVLGVQMYAVCREKTIYYDKSGVRWSVALAMTADA